MYLWYYDTWLVPVGIYDACQKYGHIYNVKYALVLEAA